MYESDHSPRVRAGTAAGPRSNTRRTAAPATFASGLCVSATIDANSAWNAGGFSSGPRAQTPGPREDFSADLDDEIPF